MKDSTLSRLERARTRLGRELSEKSLSEQMRQETRTRLHAVTDQINALRDRLYLAELDSLAAMWSTFVYSDCQKRDYTPGLYRLLRSVFGFIAHSDRGGFWEARFSTLADTIGTLAYIAKYQPTGYLAPIELRMQSSLEESGALLRLTTKQKQEIEISERAELARLQTKYETLSCPLCQGVDSTQRGEVCPECKA